MLSSVLTSSSSTFLRFERVKVFFQKWGEEKKKEKEKRERKDNEDGNSFEEWIRRRNEEDDDERDRAVGKSNASPPGME